MNRIFISYGDDSFSESLKRIGKEAKRTKRFDRIILYTPKDLPDSIKASPLFCFEKGGGYWVWKPYLLYKTLEQCREGDIVYYVDAGCTLCKDSKEWDEYESLMRQKDAIFFQYRNWEYPGWSQFCKSSRNNSPQIYHWQKPSVIDFFKNYTGSHDFMEFNKIWAGFLIVKKVRDMRIMDEWFKITFFHPELIIEPFGVECNHLPESFNVHRHDQSVLTPLVFYYKECENLCVLPETSESKHETAAVIAMRKRNMRFYSTRDRVKYYIKKFLWRIK